MLFIRRGDDMKFLLSINTIKAGSGGAQRVVALIADELSNQGHDVMLILYEPTSNSDYFVNEKVQKMVLKRSTGKKLKYYISKFTALRSAIRKFDPDVIIPFLADQTLYICLATIGTKYRKRIITTVRNNPRVFPKSRKLRIQNNILIALSKANFVQNNEQKNYFPRFIQNKTFVLPNPVNKELLHCRRKVREIKNIVTLGRLSEQKNQEMLINAFSMISNKHPNIKLKIYGKGEKQKQLEAYIEKMSLTERVELAGVTNNVKDVLLNSDLFVMTSNYEGMPNALIEAMATGLPCISTDCPTGPSDLISNRLNGLLIKMNSVDECVAAMEYMISNQLDAWEMGEKAQLFIKEHYRCENIVNDLVEFSKEYLY